MFAYIRLQAATGADESRISKIYGPQSWTVDGVFVLIAWVAHLLMIVTGLAAATGANLDRLGLLKKPRKKPVTPA